MSPTYAEMNGHHESGDHTFCPGCWSGYPKKCECGGVVHAEFGDEDQDSDYWLSYACDKCGYDYKEEE